MTTINGASFYSEAAPPPSSPWAAALRAKKKMGNRSFPGGSQISLLFPPARPSVFALQPNVGIDNNDEGRN